MRLVLVDDHVILREGLRAVLEGGGHEVVGEFSDPDTAFEGMVRLRPEALILDLSLGRHSGLELLQRLHDADAVVPTVVLTMSAAPRHVSQCRRLGAGGYVLKGSPMRQLIEALDAVVAGRRYVSPELDDVDADDGASVAGGNPFDALSVRERQIALGVVEGQSSAAIAQALGLSPKTVETYRSRLNAKLGVGDVASLVRLAVRHGLVDAGER